nr:type II toxin-antitoxin system RelE/ParE family toxin [Pseudoxanthomonas indica]
MWTPEARLQRITIWHHIAADSPWAALRLDARFKEAAATLAAHPQIGKPGQVRGTREFLPHSSYRLVYELTQDTVRVLTLLHTSRIWPPIDTR